MSLPEASYRQLYQAEVSATYSNWVSTLQLIKTVTDKTAREMWIDDLQDTYTKAEKLLQGVSVHPASATYLKLILSRPFDQWVTIVKHAGAVVM